MPKKIRELKATLVKAGFPWRPGEGSHTVWEHPLAEKPITLSGKDGQDVQRYQERQVDEPVRIVLQRQR